jgi:hypothetical protein
MQTKYGKKSNEKEKKIKKIGVRINKMLGKN